MGKKSRDKGATFERWLVNEMKDNLGENLLEQPSRNLSQYQQKGQSDIIIPGFAFEAKAYAKGYTHKKDWWVQACEQGTGMTCAISLPTLWYIVREKLAEMG